VGRTDAVEHALHFGSGEQYDHVGRDPCPLNRLNPVRAQCESHWSAGPVHDGSDFAASVHIISHAGRTLAAVEAGPLSQALLVINDREHGR